MHSTLCAFDLSNSGILQSRITTVFKIGKDLQQKNKGQIREKLAIINTYGKNLAVEKT